ncbi:MULTISPECIES: hypothetical protein [unclassified Streptomyces]|uniref:hypothetical protein n=1 Tax=unclassified Streptomyces TaxID=2593676 RepID=UPI002365A735|nr:MULTISPECIES: hypothetical protein [unclassified Streptomyces]MDF3146439.1 hypothetical protein [Streptomyces sp. T21Q-yed]WDF42109.1 hypothetical protein PBV52_37585 [Streptomyces sp. T12]
MTRRITTLAAVHGMDYEVFGANEHGSGVRNGVDFFQDGEGYRRFFDSELRWGGECRGEVHLDGLVQNNELFVKGEALLYEGTSEDTGDLDGREELSFSVPKGATVQRAAHVTNTDESSEDYVHWDLTISNNIVE